MTKFYSVLLSALAVCSLSAQAAPDVVFKAPSVEFHAPANTGIITEQPAGVEMMYSRSGGAYYAIMGSVKMEAFEGIEARIIAGDDGSYYLYNPSSQADTQSYLKLDPKDPKTLVAHLPQAIAAGTSSAGQEYLYANKMNYTLTSAPGEPEEGTYKVDTSDNSITFTLGDDGVWSMEGAGSPDVILGLADKNGNWYGYGEFGTKFTPFKDSAVEIPAGLEISEWSMTYGDAGHNVKVGFDGKDVYIQGIFQSFPEAWVKGQLDKDIVTVPSKQYLGIEPRRTHFSYFNGADVEQIYNDYYDEYQDKFTPNEAAQFTYDPEAGTLSCDKGIVLTTPGPTIVYQLEAISKPLMRKKDANISLIPADPTITTYEPYDDDYEMGALEFDMPQTNVDGILLDKNKLFYRLYLDDKPFTFTTADYMGLEEDMELIPFGFNDDYYDISSFGISQTVIFYCSDFERMGVQSVYIVEAGEHCSKIVYTDGYSGIGSITGTDSEIVSERYFDLSGREVSHPDHGIYIRRTVNADGKVSTSKIAITR